ncbi:IS66 family transposase [Frankia umida]|uniref:IS66 family transposase n=1 Tax=Frankia umida TaxID=573489 RepID=UPI003555C057
MARAGGRRAAGSGPRDEHRPPHPPGRGPPAARDRLVGEFRAAVRVGLSEVAPAAKGTKQPPARCLLEFLRGRETDVLRFVDDLDVWPTNNTSERDLRPLKTQQKISGRLTSEPATRHRLAVAPAT